MAPSPVRLFVDNLRRSLLDLTNRNPLINLRTSNTRGLSFSAPADDIGYLLLEKRTIGIAGLGIKPTTTRQRNSQSVNDVSEVTIARQLGIPVDRNAVTSRSSNKLQTLHFTEDLARICRRIERMQNSSLQETGSHILYLCVGFLEYPESPQSTQLYRAPLITIPVQISKTPNAVDAYEITYTGDEIIENTSLYEKLLQTYNIKLPSIETDSSTFERDYLARVNQITAKHAQFTVQHHVTLALLSFTNMLIYQDLDPSIWGVGVHNKLLRNPIIRQLVLNDPDSNPSQIDINTSSTNLDSLDIPLIYDADSSQLKAIDAAVQQKRNMVILGPPGTGKSQTITNLIAAYLAQGKTVLFVAEKLAALEVVKNRLSKAGLEPFLLELHSNKTNKKSVLESINQRLTYSPGSTLKSYMLSSHLKLRHKLAQYTQHLQSRIDHLTINYSELYWRSIALKQHITCTDFSNIEKLYVDDATDIDSHGLADRKHLLSEIHTLFTKLDRSRFKSYAYFQVRPNTTIVYHEIANIIHYLHDTTTMLRAIVAELNQAISIDISRYSIEDLTEQYNTIAPLPSLLHEQFNTSDFVALCITNHDPDKTNKILKQFNKERTVALNSGAQVHKYFNTTIPYDQTTYDSLRDALKYLITYTRNIHECNNMQSWIKTTLSFQSELFHDIEHTLSIAQKLSLPLTRTSNAAHIINTESTFALWNDTKDYDITLLAKIAFTPDINSRYAQLCKTQAALQAQYAALHPVFNFANELPDQHVIKQTIDILESKNPWIGFLFKDWREANALFTRIAITPTGVPVATRIKQLHMLLDYLQSLDAFLNDEFWRRNLRIKPTLNADLTNLKVIMSWFENTYTQHKQLHINIIPFLNQPEALLGRYLADIQYLHTQIVKLKHSYKMVTNNVPIINTQLSAQETIQRLREFEKHTQIIARFLTVNSIPVISYTDFDKTLDHWSKLHDVAQKILTNQDYQNAFAHLFKGLNTDTESIQHYINIGNIIHNPSIHSDIRHMIARNHNTILSTNQLILLLSNATQQMKQLQESVAKLHEYLDVNITLRCHTSVNAYITTVHQIASVINTTNFEHWLNYSAALRTFEHMVGTKHECIDIGDEVIIVPQNSVMHLHHIDVNTAHIVLAPTRKHLGTIKTEIDDVLPAACNQSHPQWLWYYLQSGIIESHQLADIYEYIYLNTFIQFNKENAFHDITNDDPPVSQHGKDVHTFTRLDKQVIALQGNNIGSTLLNNYVPAGTSGARVDEKTEWALLKYLIPQQRPRMPIRKFMARAKRSIIALKPCFMMSPQSVAQFLDPDTFQFDVVIMDEASQMTPGEAVGAIARGKQLIVVGDPKQLPPTQFFAQHNQIDADDIAIESVLEWCAQRFDCVHDLRWHYRSQHHTLITFSNQHFYNNSLHVFPSPYRPSKNLGITRVYVKDALYHDQLNELEATKIVAQIQAHIQHNPKESLGVVTLNIKQREFINELVESRLGHLSSYQSFITYWQHEETPFFIKNLENVQGDERDVIIISTTFGPNADGKVLQNFGPISRDNGWRRLNVLFTRAKRSIILVTSLRPSDITIHDTTPRGTRAFKQYLEYASTQDELDINTPQVDTVYQHVNAHIMTILREHGYRVTQNLGATGFAIDMAIEHPNIPGTHIAAIMTDGYFYQSAESVRDRERLHIEILENLGWKNRIYRIWSNEWFKDPQYEQQKLLEFLAPIYAQAMNEQPITTHRTETTESSSPVDQDDILARIRDFINFNAN
jgi:superfamily I DNA and/or RNA helicase